MPEEKNLIMIESAADQAEARRALQIRERLNRGEQVSQADQALLQRVQKRLEDQRRTQVLSDVPQKMLIELLDTSNKMMCEWEAAGIPLRQEGRNKFYNLFRVLPWLKKRWLNGGSGENLDGLDPLARAAREKAKLEYIIERTVLVRTERKIRESGFIGREEVRQQHLAKVAAVRCGLWELKQTLAPLVAACSDVTECEKIIEEHMRDLFNRFAGAKAE